MTERNYDEFFEHDHDGIKEYDNPLPGWWTWLFVLSIVFSACYLFYYHVGTGASVEEKYDAAVVAHLEKQLASFGELAADDRTIMRLLDEKPDMIAAVGGVFRGNCAQCHEADGGGNIGPNLTDDHWKNVTRPSDIYTVISEGIPGTAMLPWKNRMREPQIILLAAYVTSLRGTTPASPLPADGSRIDPWPTLEELAPEPETGDPESS